MDDDAVTYSAITVLLAFYVGALLGMWVIAQSEKRRREQSRAKLKKIAKAL